MLATEISWSKEFAGVKKINKPVSTNMLHIKGVPTKNFSEKLYIAPVVYLKSLVSLLQKYHL